jgi:hypothetical protein
MKTGWIIVGMAVVALATTELQAAPVKGYSARISVKEKIEKERESSKDESEKSSTKSKSERQTYKLAITVANTVKKEGTFDLEWYFLSRSLGDDGKKGDPAVCQKDKTTLTIGGMKRVVHPVASRELTWTEVKTSRSGSNNSGKSSGGKSFSGEMYEGYVVLLKIDGEILAKYSNENKFLSAEWLVRLDKPIVSGGAKSREDSKKKRRNKKS